MPPQSGSTNLETLPSGGRVHVLGAGPVGLLLTALLQSMEGFSVRLYEKRREYTRTRMVRLALVPRGGFRRELPCRSHRWRERRGRLRSGRARRGPRVQTVDSFGPDGTSSRMGTGVLPAQRHRALPQRSDRYARVECGAAHRGRRNGGGRDGDARAGRHPDRLHRQQVAASRSPGARLRRGGWRREHAQHPARIRARHHLPVRPDIRLQRVLQVLQEHRERALQVHSDGPPHVLRRQRQPRDGHRQHHRRGL